MLQNRGQPNTCIAKKYRLTGRVFQLLFLLSCSISFPITYYKYTSQSLPHAPSSFQ